MLVTYSPDRNNISFRLADLVSTMRVIAVILVRLCIVLFLFSLSYVIDFVGT